MSEPQNRDAISASVSSRLVVLYPNGDELPVTDELLSSAELGKYPNLKALVVAEHSKGEPSIEPPSIKAMRDLELVDYEPASDKGHFRFYPKGALVFNLLHQWAEHIALDRLNCYAIETPIIYDWAEPDIREQAQSFHENHYIVRVPNNPNKEFILRFAGDFGLFRMMRDARLTYRHLPVRLYEFAPSFRFERSGALAGLRRLRGFWMPDIHSFCADLKQGQDEYRELYCRYTDLARGTGVAFAVAFRVVEDFYHEHKGEIAKLAEYSGGPVLIELLSKMKHYWVMKHEICTIDGAGAMCQTSTVQLDIKDASLYGITYLDQDDTDRGCIIVHSSIGSPERWIYSLLEDALKKKVPSLPLWLAPIQVRILPVGENHLEFCVNLAESLKTLQIRADVDDRQNSIGWKIRNAEREWVPFVIVCGDKEVGGSKFSVRIRGEGEKALSQAEVVQFIKGQTAKMPFRSLPGLLVSKRPVFRGRD